MILNLINKLFKVTILWCLVSVVWAASFDLITLEHQVDEQQSITLSFKLSDAKATQEPDFSSLQQIFDIYSQGTASSYSLINGNLSQSVTWSLVVFPKKIGKMTIPKISIKTSKGVLTSNEVEIEVISSKGGSGAGQNTSSSKNTASTHSKEVYLQGNFKSEELYINQPFVYTLKIFTKVPTANMTLNDLHAEDAIIERHGEPVQYNTFLHGEQVNVTEVKYIITPLKAGKLTINPASVRYEILNTFFNRYHSGPATAYSEEEILKILEIPSKAQPFSSLQLEDVWDNVRDDIQENDSISRTIKLRGEDGYVDGLIVNLPKQSAEYNLYQDKPKETKTLTKDERVQSEKIINYTIIPLQAGQITIPKATIKWWNIKKRQLETLEIPEKKITVLASTKPVSNEESTADLPKEITNVPVKESSVLLWISLALNLSFIIFHAFKWLKAKSKPKPKMQLEDVKTVEELKSYINQFVTDTWRIKGNLPLKDLWHALAKANFNYDKELARELTNKLNSNLYFKEELQVSKAIDLWRKFSFTVAKKSPTKEQASKAKLNPI